MKYTNDSKVENGTIILQNEKAGPEWLTIGQNAL